MPELPEVETVRRVLEKNVLNKKISMVDIRYDRIIANISCNSFKSCLENNTIVELKRVGKYLIFVLENGYLLSHLRMEGKYKFDKDLIDKHSHIIFYFEDGSLLIYHDVRKFGRMFYFNKDVDIYNVYPLNELGLEPFNATSSYLLDKLKNKKGYIKEALLDQSILAGIGNIYADEILYASKISPFRKANNVNLEECNLILENAKNILNNAIKLGGSTIKSFQSAHGVDGRFQINLKVYQQENNPCKECGTLIVRKVIGQRGAHFCPNCQK